ncbi:Bestrophin, RFP-TM, chloride channel-domain-containing protein [Schizothecium vesticola]|uniref:Bestrophin, RFP-TM, chloride channel-domain-containing protein n=1 Tax=Schizothecium vesticola TaxID=314040 RepID=A0AA40K0I0_9PEZI|nr:Bestrophin, RFP-TM, chloride channel-domain-containing protein [Schizothecium vesticola]
MGGEDGGAAPAEALAPPPGQAPAAAPADQNRPADIAIIKHEKSLADLVSPLSPHDAGPPYLRRRSSSIDAGVYFKGPRNTEKHSKWPIFLQMHGSIMPKMILPLVSVAAWATLFTVIHMKVTKIGISSILLTVLGFVVGLGLSFRSSTAYERYNEGRRYWAQLVLTSQNLARIFWVHAKEREGELGKKDLLAKLTALNLIVAFSIALKHKLRFEPYTYYADIDQLVAHLDIFAKDATTEQRLKEWKTKKSSFFKGIGEYLGISFAESNPRKAVKQAEDPLGNLPLEIISYLGGFADELVANGQLPVAMHQTMCYNNLLALNDVLTGTDRVLNTPLPIAYAIAIAQITWVYVLLLPFQLLIQLEWITIPATVAAAYIILGILMIGREIENPFGSDVNDLPLEVFCKQIAGDMDVIASRAKAPNSTWVETSKNMPLFPTVKLGYTDLATVSEQEIRGLVKERIRRRMTGHYDYLEDREYHERKHIPHKTTVEEV